jgi:ribulose-phosphate 3-epimerase
MQAAVGLSVKEPAASGAKRYTATGEAAESAKAGVVFNPSTPPQVIEWMMEDIDLILVMSINPGFGGQSFMTSQLKKIEDLRAMIDASGKDIVLEVDGGVTPETAPLCVAAGATALVAGSAVFRGGAAAYADNIRALRVI